MSKDGKPSEKNTALAPVAAKTELATADSTPEGLLAAALAGELETGFEGTRSDDFVMPLFNLLQKGSPQCDPAKPKYMAEARPGQFLDATTKELLNEAHVIPCLYKAQMVEWKPDLGGFVNSHELGIEQGLPRNEKGQYLLPNGNVLVDTRYFYCLRLGADGQLIPIIISLSSTQIKKAKDWMSSMLSKTTKNKKNESVPYPIYIWVCKLTSIPESNGKYSWFGWKIEIERMINDKEAATFMNAKNARTTFEASSKKMRPPTPDEEATPTGENEGKI